MIKAIATNQSGLFSGPLGCRGAEYLVESDGLLNPQPTPDEHAVLAHYAHTFCVREISEDRAAQLEWPGWEVDPDETETKPDGIDPEDDTDTGDDTSAVDHHALSWNDLRSYAKDQGVTATTKADILAELDELAAK